MPPNELGIYIGRDIASKTALWAAAEDSWIIVGPTRSGKTMRVLVRTILDAPGPVVTTSIRLDTLTLTAAERMKVGPVSVFDPLGTTGWPSPMRWSPIRGCEDALVARRRANGFASATGIDASHGDGAYWVRSGARVIQTYLHAAALGGATLNDLLSWSHDPTDPRPVALLRRFEGQAARGWADRLESAAHRDRRQRDSVWSVVEAALDCFSDQRVADACGDTNQPFDVASFLAERGTLYAVGAVDEQELLAPLITAMLEDVTAEARNLARRSPHGRLHPFLTAAIDEAATIAPLPSLPTMISSDGGNGIATMMVLQSPAQARKRWGVHDAAAMWDASTVRLIFGGLSGTEDLEAVSQLAGMVDEEMRSHTRSRRDATESLGVRQVPALPVARLRSLPTGHAVVFHRRALPVEVEIAPWWEVPALRRRVASSQSWVHANGLQSC